MGEKIEDLIINGNRALKDLKVVELRCELEKRGLTKYGTKKQLSQRLANFEESQQKSQVAKTKQGTPNQWLEEDSNLANDFIRDYFKSQKALLAEHIEHKIQRGECDAPAPIVDSSIIKETPLDDAQPSCSQKATRKASNKEHHEKALPEPPPASNRGVKLTIRTKCDPDISSHLGRQSKNNAESKILSCSLLEEQDGNELETFHRSRRKKQSCQKNEKEKKSLTKPLKIKIGDPPKSHHLKLEPIKDGNSYLTSNEKSYLSPQNAEVSSSVEEPVKLKISKTILHKPAEEKVVQVEKLLSHENDISLKPHKDTKVIPKQENTLSKTNIEVIKAKNSEPPQKTPSTTFLKAKPTARVIPTTYKGPTRTAAISKMKPLTQVVNTSKKNSSLVNRSKFIPNVSNYKKISRLCPDVAENRPQKKRSIPKRSDLFESLKQQIELPLHVEKFPSSERIEVSSTSELSSQFIKPVSIDAASYDFQTICKEMPPLDTQIFVESHLDTDAIADNSNNNSPLVDPLLINTKDFSTISSVHDKIAQTECGQNICLDLGGILGKSKKDSYLMKNILKENEPSINRLPHYEETNVQIETNIFSDKKLSAVGINDSDIHKTVIDAKECKAIIREPVVKNTIIDKRKYIKHDDVKLIYKPISAPTEENLGITSEDKREHSTELKMDILEAATLAADIDKTYDSKKETKKDHIHSSEHLSLETLRHTEETRNQQSESFDKVKVNRSLMGSESLKNAEEIGNQQLESFDKVKVNRSESPICSDFPLSVQQSSATIKTCSLVNIVDPANSTNVLLFKSLPVTSTIVEPDSSKTTAEHRENQNAILNHETEKILQLKNTQNICTPTLTINSTETDSNRLCMSDSVLIAETENSLLNADASVLSSKPVSKILSISNANKKLCIPDTTIVSSETESKTFRKSKDTSETENKTSFTPEGTIIYPRKDNISLSTAEGTIITEKNISLHMPSSEVDSKSSFMLENTIVSSETENTSLIISDPPTVSSEIDGMSISIQDANKISPESDNKNICIPGVTISSTETDTKLLPISDETVVSLEADNKSLNVLENAVSPEIESKILHLTNDNIVSSEIDKTINIQSTTIISPETDNRNLYMPSATITSTETYIKNLLIPDPSVVSSEADNESLGVLQTNIVSSEADSKSLAICNASTISPEIENKIIPGAATISTESDIKSLSISDITVVSSEANKKCLFMYDTDIISSKTDNKSLNITDEMQMSSKSEDTNLGIFGDISSETDIKSIQIPDVTAVSSEKFNKGLNIIDTFITSDTDCNNLHILDANMVSTEIITKSLLIPNANIISPETDRKPKSISDSVIIFSETDRKSTSISDSIIISNETDEKSLFIPNAPIISPEIDRKTKIISDSIIISTEPDRTHVSISDSLIISETDKKRISITDSVIISETDRKTMSITDSVIMSETERKNKSISDSKNDLSEIDEKSLGKSNSAIISPESYSENLSIPDIVSSERDSESLKVVDASISPKTESTSSYIPDVETDKKVLFVHNKNIVPPCTESETVCISNENKISHKTADESLCNTPSKKEEHTDYECTINSISESVKAVTKPNSSLEIIEFSNIPDKNASTLLSTVKEISELGHPPHSAEVVVTMAYSDGAPNISTFTPAVPVKDFCTKFPQTLYTSETIEKGPCKYSPPNISTSITNEDVAYSDCPLNVSTPNSPSSVMAEADPSTKGPIHIEKYLQQDYEQITKEVRDRCDYLQTLNETKDKLALPSLATPTPSEVSITNNDAETALIITDPSSVDTFICHNIEEPSSKLSQVEMGRHSKSKSLSEDHKKSRHHRDDLSPPREKIRKRNDSESKEESEIVSTSDHKIKDTIEQSKKPVISLNVSNKVEESENNDQPKEGSAKEVTSVVAEDDKEQVEVEKKDLSRSRRGDSSKDSHKQRSKDKRRSRSRSSERGDIKKHKKSSHRSESHSRHSTERSARKSRKQETSEVQKEKMPEVRKKVTEVENVSDTIIAPIKESLEDTLEILLNPGPDLALLEDVSMDMELLKKTSSEPSKPKREKHTKKVDEPEENRTKESVPFTSARKVTLNRSKVSEDSRKRKWGSSQESKSSLEISSFSLKSLIPDVKPLSSSELKFETGSEKSTGDEATPTASREKVNGRQEEHGNEEASAEKDAKPRKRRHLSKERDRDGRRDKHSRRESDRRDDSRRRGYDDKASSRHTRSIQVMETKQLGSSNLGIPVARNPISPVIVVCNLVRPFTIKQLKDLLQRTGTLTENGFWIDNIKSKCIAMFEEEDQAEETRIALHGVKWPLVNPKHLLVDYSSEAELKKKLQETPHLNPIIVEDAKYQRRKMERPMREWDLAKVGERSPGEKERERERQKRDREQEKTRERRREESPRPERPISKKQVEVKSLDDLFSKTKAQPSIYWLPLTSEEISEKEVMRLKKMAEQERREAEMKAIHERQRLERFKERQRRRERSRSNRRSRRSPSISRRRRSKTRSRSRS